MDSKQLRVHVKLKNTKINYLIKMARYINISFDMEKDVKYQSQTETFYGLMP